MEQQEEKKRKDYGRRGGQSKSTSSFAMDLMSEILLRLPLKYVVRFRCVSRLWSSITTDPYFSNLFQTRSPRPSLLVCIQKNDNLFVSSIPRHSKNSNKSYSSSQPIDHCHVKLPGKYRCFPPSESVHDLICFQDSGKPIVWNPSMRRFLNLTSPSESWGNIKVLLGYDPVEGKHKVLCIPACPQSCSECRVLTWRTVRTNHEHRSHMHTSWQCVKGVIYYLAYVVKTSNYVMVSFDVRSENFDMIEVPSSVIRMKMMMNYEGKLALVENKGSLYGITLWILEDAEKHKWSTKDFLAPFSHYDDHSLRTTVYRLRGVTHAGEFIYVPAHELSKSFYILFCDSMTNCWRRFEFKGTADDGSGLHISGGTSRVHAYLNHTESLLSL